MTKPARPKGKPLTPAERQGIIDDYAAGASIRSIWLKHGYAKPTIHKAIRSAGMELRGDATPAKFSDPQLRAWHRYKWTAQEIADKTGAHTRTVHRRMAKLGLVAHHPPEEPSNLPAADIVAAYADGNSLRALGDLHEVSGSTIRRLIVMHGGRIRTNSAPPRLSPLLLADMCRRGLTTQQIADATGAARDTVQTHLKDNGLQTACTVPGRERPAIYEISPPAADTSEAVE